MKLSIRNFRSVKNQDLELAPLTVVYGHNGAGKSTLIYALPTLKNVILNPNQPPAAFFNYSFITLGAFDAVVFDHQLDNQIEIGVSLAESPLPAVRRVDYSVTLAESQITFRLRIVVEGGTVDSSVSAALPYALNQQAQLQFSDPAVVLSWNGITAQVAGAVQPEQQEKIQQLLGVVGKPVDIVRHTGIVPLRRGFSKAHYAAVPVTALLASEDEVATMLSQNKYLVSKISFYLEQIVGRDFRVNVQPGTGLFSLDTLDRQSGIGTELVNEGFGVNQLVYLLAKCLQRDVEWLCVEEPEIHLHPSALRHLVAVLVRLVQDEGKKFLISTHSEPFVAAVLTEVVKQDLKPTDVACYLAMKEKRVTRFERQRVNEQGQIEGGLMSFVKEELEDVRTFLRVE